MRIKYRQTSVPAYMKKVFLTEFDLGLEGHIESSFLNARDEVVWEMNKKSGPKVGHAEILEVEIKNRWVFNHAE